MTTVAEYHEAVKARLIADPLIVRFDVRRERRTIDDGHLRVVLILRSGEQLEFSEYVRQERGQVGVVTYSFHWSDPDGNLIRRWDNAPHFAHLPQAPHHIHDGDEQNIIPGAPMSVMQILDEITALLSD